MRWLFLLLVVLNIIFYVWHQQEAPFRGKEVLPLSMYKGGEQGIRLLSEARPELISVVGGQGAPGECFSLRGFSDEGQVRDIQNRFVEMGFATALAQGDGPGYVLSIGSQDGLKASAGVLQALSNEINELKYKKIPCEGLQRPDGLHRMAPAPQ